jgi:hypothetical protein
MDTPGRQEIRTRQALARLGYHLLKKATGECHIVEAFSARIVAASGLAMDLDAIEKWAERLTQVGQQQTPSFQGGRGAGGVATLPSQPQTDKRSRRSPHLEM